MSDPRIENLPVGEEEPTGSFWGWIAGMAILALIAFVVMAGWNTNDTPRAPVVCTTISEGNGVYRFENCGNAAKSQAATASKFIAEHPELRVTAISQNYGELYLVTEKR